MRYLHTMLRVRNLDAAIDFYCNKLGLTEVRRRVDEKNKYTLVFLAAPGDRELVAKGPDSRQASDHRKCRAPSVPAENPGSNMHPKVADIVSLFSPSASDAKSRGRP